MKKRMMFLLMVLVLVQFVVAESFLVDGTHWQLEEQQGLNILWVEGLNQSEYSNDYLIPHYEVKHKALSSLPVKDVKVEFLHPINITANFPIRNQDGTFRLKDCIEDEMYEPYVDFILDDFYGGLQNIWIDIYPVYYEDCSNDKAIYYQAINYTLIFEDTKNIISSYSSELKVMKNKTVDLVVELDNFTDGYIELKGFSGDYYEVAALNKTIIFEIPYDYDNNMYSLSYYKDHNVVEQHDVFVESLDFDFEIEVTKDIIKLDFRNLINEDSYIVNFLVEDRNFSVIQNITHEETISFGESSKIYDFDFCRLCDLFVTVESDLVYLKKGINLAIYEDFVIKPKEAEPEIDESSNSNLIILVALVIILLIGTLVYFRSKRKFF